MQSDLAAVTGPGNRVGGVVTQGAGPFEASLAKLCGQTIKVIFANQGASEHTGILKSVSALDCGYGLVFADGAIAVLDAGAVIKTVSGKSAKFGSIVDQTTAVFTSELSAKIGKQVNIILPSGNEINGTLLEVSTVSRGYGLSMNVGGNETLLVFGASCVIK